MLKLLALLGLLTMALMGGVTMILTLLSPPRNLGRLQCASFSLSPY
jgi:hypothetical protein